MTEAEYAGEDTGLEPHWRATRETLLTLEGAALGEEAGDQTALRAAREEVPLGAGDQAALRAAREEVALETGELTGEL